MRDQTIACIERERIIAILRGVTGERCIQTAEALYQGGIRLMEITFSQKEPGSGRETAAAIASVSRAYQGRMLIGAGTVATIEQAELAAAAGAKDIISPDVNPEVIRRTRELGIVSIPGAATPTEILAAHRAGADFVKLFPAAALGCGYLKAVRAPLGHVKLLAVGGVDEENVAGFLQAGAAGAGVGGNLANRQWIEAGAFEKIAGAARRLTEAVQSASLGKGGTA